MKVNRGFQELMMNLHIEKVNDFECMFFSGDMPTEEEVLTAIKEVDSNFLSSDMLHIPRAVAWITSRPSCDFIAYQLFPDYREFKKLEGETETEYVIDLTANVQNAIHIKDGTIGFMAMFPTGHASYTHTGTMARECLMFFSVGSIGSGADIELTELDFVEGDNIRMNSISITL